MSQQLPSSVLTTLDEALENLMAYYDEYLPVIKAILEAQFLKAAHFATGTFSVILDACFGLKAIPIKALGQRKS